MDIKTRVALHERLRPTNRRPIIVVDDAVHYAVTRDDVERFGESVLGRSYFLILNLAVGGTFDGDPRSDAIFPATMLVDFVRVYTRR